MASAQVDRAEVASAQSDRAVGVGPWVGEWPDDERFDPELLRGGDRRNVVDKYRYWRQDAIVADLDERRHPFHVAVENWEHDFNIGTVVRNANAFLAAEVHIVGKRKWNRRGAMVTDRYQHVSHHPQVAGFVEHCRARGLSVIGVDNLPGSVPIESFDFPRDCVLVFGQEGPGLSEQVREAADAVVSISQFGSTRSINAGVASGVAMHSWIRQHGLAAAADEASPTLGEVVSALDLSPLPGEGGFFRRTHFDASSSVILYCIGGTHVSKMHRLTSSETWYHHSGAAVELLVLDEGSATTVVLGPDREAGELPHFTVKADAWQGAVSHGSWSVLSTSMAPRFESGMIELGLVEVLIAANPEVEDLLRVRT
ncbi:MAG: hypothetical protein GXP35_02775 [Actinobacteria bacterium]|nr:hypothetical protein [Actinomycetota bacterium]